MRTKKLALFLSTVALGIFLTSCSFESVRTDSNSGVPKDMGGVDTINPSQAHYVDTAKAAPTAAPATTDSTKAVKKDGNGKAETAEKKMEVKPAKKGK